jgi:hypothetical protein
MLACPWAGIRLLLEVRRYGDQGSQQAKTRQAQARLVKRRSSCLNLVKNKLLASRSLVLASPSPSTTLVLLMSSPRYLLERRRGVSPDLYIYAAPD